MNPPAAASEIAAVRLLLLERMGVNPEQLFASAADKTEAPSFSEYTARVSAAVSAGTRRVYSSYWQRIGEVWGDRRIDAPTPLEIKELAESVKAHAINRRNSRGGRTAAEHLIAALRCVYRYAEADGLIAEADNPARKVPKPRRLASTRHALAEARLAEVCQLAARSGNDPSLNSLLLRLHTETACRRGGALALRRLDLDVEQCLIRLREKAETIRWQPVSPTLMRWLCAHHDERGNGRRAEQLLRYRNGRPITARRYDHLWQRLGRQLPWVATQGVSTHWLRHTTLTWVERHFGYAVARAYAGHSRQRDSAATTTYVRANLHEVAAPLTALTGEAHPLGTPWHRFLPATPAGPLDRRSTEGTV